jgi:hypothetical protein
MVFITTKMEFNVKFYVIENKIDFVDIKAKHRYVKGPFCFGFKLRV